MNKSVLNLGLFILSFSAFATNVIAESSTSNSAIESINSFSTVDSTTTSSNSTSTTESAQSDSFALKAAKEYTTGEDIPSGDYILYIAKKGTGKLIKNDGSIEKISNKKVLTLNNNDKIIVTNDSTLLKSEHQNADSTEQNTADSSSSNPTTTSETETTSSLTSETSSSTTTDSSTTTTTDSETASSTSSDTENTSMSKSSSSDSTTISNSSSSNKATIKAKTLSSIVKNPYLSIDANRHLTKEMLVNNYFHYDGNLSDLIISITSNYVYATSTSSIYHHDLDALLGISNSHIISMTEEYALSHGYRVSTSTADYFVENINLSEPGQYVIQVIDASNGSTATSTLTVGDLHDILGLYSTNTSANIVPKTQSKSNVEVTSSISKSSLAKTLPKTGETKNDTLLILGLLTLGILIVLFYIQQNKFKSAK